jgi:hypothetical protein
MALTTADLVKHICSHPRVFCGGIETTRELIIFLCGVCCGAGHLHGDDLGGFSAYVCRRFNRSHISSWPVVLWEEFGNKPLSEGCDGVLGVLRDWFASQAVEKGDTG